MARSRCLFLLFVVAASAITFDWTVKHFLLGALGSEIPVRNHSEAGVTWLLPTMVVSVALVALWPYRLMVIGAGLALGGCAANRLDRELFGPVADFLNTPGSDMYYNCADLMIAAGLIIAAASVLVGAVRGELRLV